MKGRLAVATMFLAACTWISGAADLVVGDDGSVTVPGSDGAGDTGVSEGAAGDAPAPDASAPELLSILSPYRDGGLAYPMQIRWTLAALGPIHYTTDGTDPTPATPGNDAGLVNLNGLADGTVIKWTVGDSTNVHSFTVHLDPDASADFGLAMDRFILADSGSPLAVVSLDAGTVTASAHIRLWNQTSCQGCLDVVTLGTETASGCFAPAGVPGLYPGLNTPNATFDVAVPTTPGIYPVRSGLAQVYGCEAGLAEPLSDTQVGVLVVTP